MVQTLQCPILQIDVIWMKSSSLATPEVVKMTASNAVIEAVFIISFASCSLHLIGSVYSMCYVSSFNLGQIMVYFG